MEFKKEKGSSEVSPYVVRDIQLRNVNLQFLYYVEGVARSTIPQRGSLENPLGGLHNPRHAGVILFAMLVMRGG